MSKNYCFRKDNLDEITKEYMGGVLTAAMNCGISSVAPLGFSGDDFYMYGKFINKDESESGSWKRESVVSLRNYCNSPQLLITDKDGMFLVYSTYDGLPFNDLLDMIYDDFIRVKKLINKKASATFKKQDKTDDVEFSWAFDMLTDYAKLATKNNTIYS
ncbi:hypothetical protein GYA27_03155 [candidate division WWE3 bacterium]|uniref:Uncharacterized protein n=1 Tax=candidate division WWE3 bacterium TaxID=2053526 RepID=A0A7X9DKN7_UNCKA|nr:hypothetical protein [candidate division WWE3 bacterium]